MKAHEILTEAAKILEERGKLRDTEQGERSMARAVSAFNALVPDKALDEGQGWLFMCCLKMARATAGKPHLDDASDLAGYAALLGEWVAKQAPRVEVAKRCLQEGKLPPPPRGFRYNVDDLARPHVPGQVYRLEEDDGWIPWNGDVCPVGTRVRVTVRYGKGLDSTGHAEDYDWRRRGLVSDIIAYKVVD